MNVDQKLINRMKRFQVIPADDGTVTIYDGFDNRDIAKFEGPDALKRAGLMYREILGIDSDGTAGSRVMSTDAARAITAGFRTLFPEVRIETAANSDGTYTITLPERSAGELGVNGDRGTFSARITNLTGIALEVTGTAPVKRFGARFIAVTVKPAGSTS